jgi:hypothetical protein
MSNDQETSVEISIDTLRKLLEGADIVCLDSEEEERITYHSIGDEGITMNFENYEGEEYLFLFNNDALITQEENRIVIVDPKKPEEPCMLRMFKRVPYSG